MKMGKKLFFNIKILCLLMFFCYLLFLPALGQEIAMPVEKGPMLTEVPSEAEEMEKALNDGVILDELVEKPPVTLPEDRPEEGKEEKIPPPAFSEEKITEIEVQGNNFNTPKGNPFINSNEIRRFNKC